MGSKRDALEAWFATWLEKRGIEPEHAAEMARMEYRGLRGDDNLFVQIAASELAIEYAMSAA